MNNLPKRTWDDKALRNKTLSIGKNPKHDGYQRVLTSMFFKFLNKKYSSSAAKSENILNQKLFEEILKVIIRKFEKRKSTLIFYRQHMGP